MSYWGILWIHKVANKIAISTSIIPLTTNISSHVQSYFHEIQSLYTLNDDISSYKNFMFLEVNANTKWNKIMLIPKFVRWNRIGICFQNNITTNAVKKNRRKKKKQVFVTSISTTTTFCQVKDLCTFERRD